MQDEVYMLKTLISLSYVDHNFSQAEKEWIISLINRYEFSEDEKADIENEMQSPNLDFTFYFKQIKSPVKRSKTLDFSRHLFQKDGNFSTEEKNAFKRLKDIHVDLTPELLNQDKVAKDIIKEDKEKRLYKDLDKFAEILNEIDTTATVWSTLGYPFNILPRLFRSGRFGFALAITIVVIVILILFKKFLL